MKVIALQEGVMPKIQVQGNYAVVAITKHGIDIGRNLMRAFGPRVDFYYMEKFARGDEEEKGIQLFTGSVRMLFPALFKQYDGLILIISLGAVVRMIAPVLVDKKTDPGIVVVDDRAENVISVLSGHLGGANELTREVAYALGARPIITTASDVQKTIPVDLFGARFGWKWENEDKLTPVSASVVNEERVAVVQEAGEKNWWMHDTKMPENIYVFETIEEAKKIEPNAYLVVTHRLLTADEEVIVLQNGVVFRPKSVVIGMGCNRGTSAEEIEQVIQETMKEHRLSMQSIRALCTFELKKDEVGLVEVCKKYGWEFVYYTKEELNEMKLDSPSETVFKYTGVYGVSEPAVKRYIGRDDLILTKKKSGNCTISIGTLSFEE